MKTNKDIPFDIYNPEIPEGYYEVFEGKIKEGDFLFFEYFNTTERKRAKHWDKAGGLIGSGINGFTTLKKVCRPLPISREGRTIDVPDGFSIVLSGPMRKGDFYLSTDKWIECEGNCTNYRPLIIIRRTKKER